MTRFDRTMSESENTSATDEFPRNTALAEALAASVDRPVKARQAVYQALLSGVALVPAVRGSPAERAAVAVFPTPEGGQELIGFSGVDALRTWSREARTFVAIPGDELARLARRHQVDGVLLNPASASAMSLAPTELDMLADGLIPSAYGSAAATVAWPRSRQIQPTHFAYPDAAVEHLRDPVRGQPDVEAVHLLDIAYGGGEPIPTVAVRFAPVTDSEALLQEIAESVAAALPRGTEGRHQGGRRGNACRGPADECLRELIRMSSPLSYPVPDVVAFSVCRSCR